MLNENNAIIFHQLNEDPQKLYTIKTQATLLIKQSLSKIRQVFFIGFSLQTLQNFKHMIIY